MYKKIAKTVLTVPVVLLTGAGVVHSAEFGVFADTTFSDSGVDGDNSGFALGALDFYGTAKIDDNTRVFVEYVFENSDDGLVTDLERLWVTRTVSDELAVGVGVFIHLWVTGIALTITALSYRIPFPGLFSWTSRMGPEQFCLFILLV
ncbi:MAG: hypothetical protein GXP10_09615 [Gammaproteobacteria bacterium]|nr:hypothetical protein [Gammaproteobacteria bacterium]